MVFQNVTPQGQPYIQFTSYSPSPSIPESITSPYSASRNQMNICYNNTENVEALKNIGDINFNINTKKIVTRFIIPHKVSLLILIKEFFFETYKDILGQLIYLLLNEINEEKCLGENELYSLFQSIDKLNLEKEKIELIKETLWQKIREIQTPDDLLNFFTSIKQMIQNDSMIMDSTLEQQIYIEKNSPFGVFIRRCVLEINQMSFDELSKFFLCLMYYKNNFKKRLPIESRKRKRKEKKSKKIKLDIINNDIESISLIDTQSFINQQIELLDKCSGEIPSYELQQKLLQIHMYLPSIANVHYLSFLNCLYGKERESALEQLYRFFDYSGILHYNKEKTLYQYGLINLAVFHSYFHEIVMEKMALEEAIYTARKNKDYECLSYALSWLNKLMNQSEYISDTSNSSKLFSNNTISNSYDTKNENMLQLKCLDELGKAKDGLINGDRPINIFTSLIQGEYMVRVNSMSKLLGPCLLLKSSIWGVYGNSSLSNLAIQLQLNYYNKEIATDNKNSGICKLAMQHSLYGNYKYALSLLNNAIRKSRNYSQCEIYHKCKLEILFQKSIYRQEWFNAKYMSSSLFVMEDDNNENKINQFIRKAKYYRECHQEKNAYDTLYTIINRNIKNLNNIKNCNNILTIAEIFIDSTTNISAIPNLLSCLTLSEYYHFHSLYIHSSARIAQVLLNFNMYYRSLQIMDSILPEVLAHENLWLQNLCILIEAKCLMSEISNTMSNENNSKMIESKKKIKLFDILSLLERALNGFKKLEALNEIQEILYLQAMIFNELDFKQERDQRAKEFHNVQKKILHSKYINTAQMQLE